jgi:predicted transcriptional regulator of viral defense system
MEDALEAYVSREIPRIYRGHSLVAVNEVLPGRVIVDFHFKKSDDTDVFVEVTAKKIGRAMLNQIINIYAAISNIEPTLKKFELIVVGPEVEASTREELERIPVKLLTFEQIGIVCEKGLKLRELELRRQRETPHLSPDEAKLVVTWESENRTIIRPSDVQESLDRTPDYTYQLLHSLENKKWIERVSQGLYQFIPLSYGYPERIPPTNSYVIGASLIEPYYFSYYTSNSHYGFTTQIPYTVFIATTKKKPDFEWSGSNFKFITLSKNKFFGYRKEVIFDTKVNMAEPEKSLVDSFDKPRYAGGVEQLAGITWRGISRVKKDKLVKYAVKMNSHSLIQRLGFILSFLAEEDLVKPLSPKLENKLLDHVGGTVIYLDYKKPKTGKLSKNWKIINNVPKSQLLSEIEIR